MRHQRQVIGALANAVLNNMDITRLPGVIESLSDMVVTDLSVQDIVSLANAMRGMDTDNMWSANLPSWAGEDTYIDGQSYVFVYEDKLKEMMERVDAGEDPQGPQSMGSSSESSTVGDLGNNDSSSFSSGTDKSTSSSSGEDTSSED